MNKGKTICRTLKVIRQQVARANGISYQPSECHHRGDCVGTCPACEAEVRYLEQQLHLRRQLGKAAVIIGVSAGLLSTPVYGQSQQTTPVEAQKDTAKTARVLAGVVEQAPAFRGGNAGLLEFVEKEMVYPPAAREKRLEGRVVVSFDIEKDGRVTNAKVVRSVDPLLDAEALRLVRKMPRWMPGKQLGKCVRTKFTLPVTFKL